MRGKIFTKRTVGLFFLVIVLVAAVGIQMLAAGAPLDSERPSASSTMPLGRRALRELLTRFDTGTGERTLELWNMPPASLPRHGGVLILPQVPIGFSNIADRESEEGEEEKELQAPLQEDLFETAPTFAEHHPRHYGRFVQQGGTILAPASEEMLKWLEDSAEITVVGSVTRRDTPFSSGEDEDESEEAEEPVELESASYTWVDDRGDEASLDLAWRDEGGLNLYVENAAPFGPAPNEPRAFLQRVKVTEAANSIVTIRERSENRGVILPVGEGRVVLLSDLHLFDNQNLDAFDHAALAVWVVHRFADGSSGSTPILFDEYALGGWTPPGTSGLLLGGPVGWITLHLVLLVLFLVWRRAWAGPFPRDPERIEGLAPLERTRAEGALLLRAERYDLISEHLFDGVFHRLERRLLRTTLERPAAERAGRSSLGSAEKDPAEPPTGAAEKKAKELGESEKAALHAWRSERMERVRTALLDLDPEADLPKLPVPGKVQGRTDLMRLHRALQSWERTTQRRLDPQLTSELTEASAPSDEEHAFHGVVKP